MPLTYADVQTGAARASALFGLSIKKSVGVLKTVTGSAATSYPVPVDEKLGRPAFARIASTGGFFILIEFNKDATDPVIDDTAGSAVLTATGDPIPVDLYIGGEIDFISLRSPGALANEVYVSWFWV